MQLVYSPTPKQIPTRSPRRLPRSYISTFIGEAGQVLNLPMDEATGTTLRDISPAGNHGTRSGTSWQETPSLWGLYFNNLNDYVSSPYNLNFNGAFTIVLWFYTTVQPAANRRVVLRNAPNDEGITIDRNGGAFQGRLERSIPALNRLPISNTVIPANRWNHIVITKQAWVGAPCQWLSYLNGAADGGLADSWAFPDPAGVIRLGGNGGGLGIEGIIPEYRLYENVIFDLARVQRDYELGRRVYL